MIRYLIAANKIHSLSRPQTPEVQYTSLVDFTEIQLIGKGGQNPINCGSSMFKDTPTLEPKLSELIKLHFEPRSYLFKIEKTDQGVAKTAALNLMDFKSDLAKRKIILDRIFDPTSRTFKTNIYGGYIFIFISIYFMLNQTLFNKSSDPHAKSVAAKYFTNEADLLTKLVDALYNAPQIENTTAFCHGRYFFVDPKLCDYNDFKPVPLKIIELLRNHI
ncbi:MAG: hypothetical protein LW832_09000 [Parachlamydia sp.]|jgi:hypothetical protein|nr:hypothetical protein [Parachlamydia sp.]